MAPILNHKSLLATTTLLLASAPVVNADVEDPDVVLKNWHTVAAGKKTLVKYFDPFDRVSQHFQEHVWGKLEEKYKDDPDIKLLEVNCQSRYGLQMCIERSCDNTPELHWGDVGQEVKYTGDGNYDALVEFIEGTVRPGKCSLAFPGACPEEDRGAMAEIEKLTVEYIAKLAEFGIDQPEDYAHQAFLKFGIKNPFKNDYDNVEYDEDIEDEEDVYFMEWDGMPDYFL
jgi:hypothetical protein